jgi:hypothetical protein
MLVVEISINGISIVGRLRIQRLHPLDKAKDGICKYKIREPKGPWCKKTITHKYSDGWFLLLEKVVNILKKEGFQTKHEQE